MGAMDDRDALRAASRSIHGHGDVPPARMLADVAAWCEERDVALDRYGEGELIEAFEAEVAERLGYEAGRFMPSGTMAQQIALRIWADRAGNRTVGMHPTSHVELHEERGYAHLHGLHATLIGPEREPMLAEHLAAVPPPFAAVLTELPIREAGGQLPTWEQLEELKAVAGERGIPLHLDGARLWECAAAYGHDYAEICRGFDSCYVSFYKGIGALPGSMLLGTKDFIDEAVVWQRRSGGNLFTLTPNVASAAMQWEGRLAKMPVYLERTRRLAEAVHEIEGVRVLPDPPHVNMMHVFFDLDAEEALAARDRVAVETGIWVFNWAGPADVPGVSWTELYVGDAAMEVGDDDIARAFTLLVAGG
jgi:threonine aldolase